MLPSNTKITVAATVATVTTAAVWRMNNKKQQESVALLPAAAAGTTVTSTKLIRPEMLPSCIHAVHQGKSTFSTFGENGLTNGLCCVAGGVERGLSEHGMGVAAGLSEHGKGVVAAGKYNAIGMGFLACAMVVSAVINKKL